MHGASAIYMTYNLRKLIFKQGNFLFLEQVNWNMFKCYMATYTCISWIYKHVIALVDELKFSGSAHRICDHFLLFPGKVITKTSLETKFYKIIVYLISTQCRSPLNFSIFNDIILIISRTRNIGSFYQYADQYGHKAVSIIYRKWQSILAE